ncbi:lactonase family protein [Pendulispora rubella]|uniref:Lactonase family protein n=1 Tax=Pendulispora rubella TaxID=2741070 RepID=A0ABZ2KVY3_9BACT
MRTSSIARVLSTMGLMGMVASVAFVACGSNDSNDTFRGASLDASVDAFSDVSATRADAGLGRPLVYVGSNDGKIRTYSFDTGTYAFTLLDTVDTARSPSFLAFDPDHQYAYAVADRQGQVRAFSVGRSNGKLTPLQTITELRGLDLPHGTSHRLNGTAPFDSIHFISRTHRGVDKRRYVRRPGQLRIG